MYKKKYMRTEIIETVKSLIPQDLAASRLITSTYAFKCYIWYRIDFYMFLNPQFLLSNLEWFLWPSFLNPQWFKSCKELFLLFLLWEFVHSLLLSLLRLSCNTTTFYFLILPLFPSSPILFWTMSCGDTSSHLTVPIAPTPSVLSELVSLLSV